MTVENTCCCCQGKTKHRTPEEQKKLLNRLCRIEGQVRGLQEMLQKDAYCPDILIQVSAVGAALNSFSKELLAFRLNSLHNLTYFLNVVRQARQAILEDRYASFLAHMESLYPDEAAQGLSLIHISEPTRRS